MLAPAISLLFLLAATTVDSATSRQIASPCKVVEERAIQYFEQHDFHTNSGTIDHITIVDVGNRKNASTPSGKPLTLNRSSIHHYTLPRHLSPMKVYDNFQLEGHLRLATMPEGSCNATLSFGISAYEWVWALGVIDDGYRSRFFSNGTLERLYLDALGDLFTNAKR